MEDPGAPWLTLGIPNLPPQAQWRTERSVKHRGSLSDSFSISNGVTQGCMQTLTLFFIFCSKMHPKAKEDPSDGIYICLRTDGSPFNLRRLHTQWKTTEELITEPLFADNYAFLAQTEGALRHIVNCFSDSATAFSIIISLQCFNSQLLHEKTQSSPDRHRWQQPQRSRTLPLPG